MIVPDLFEDFAVRHIGGTSRFARKAANTFRRVKIGPGIVLQPPLGLFAPKAKATAWRIVFIARQLVGWTDFQTKAAMNAARQQILVR